MFHVPRAAACFERFATGCAAIICAVPARASLVRAASRKAFPIAQGSLAMRVIRFLARIVTAIAALAVSPGQERLGVMRLRRSLQPHRARADASGQGQGFRINRNVARQSSFQGRGIPMCRRLTIIAVLATVGAAIVAAPAVALTVGRAPVASATSRARVRLPQPIYFWGSVASTIRAPGMLPLPEVIRPSSILLFADGSWDIGHLHWTGWGSRVAHARGISSASNGIPNAAQGKRLNTPGQITLSHPGRFFGREVYRCFALTIPPPATDLRGCLEGHGGYYYLSQ